MSTDYEGQFEDESSALGDKRAAGGERATAAIYRRGFYLLQEITDEGKVVRRIVDGKLVAARSPTYSQRSCKSAPIADAEYAMEHGEYAEFVGVLGGEPNWIGEPVDARPLAPEKPAAQPPILSPAEKEMEHLFTEYADEVCAEYGLGPDSSSPSFDGWASLDAGEPDRYAKCCGPVIAKTVKRLQQGNATTPESLKRAAFNLVRTTVERGRNPWRPKGLFELSEFVDKIRASIAQEVRGSGPEVTGVSTKKNREHPTPIDGELPASGADVPVDDREKIKVGPEDLLPDKAIASWRQEPTDSGTAPNVSGAVIATSGDEDIEEGCLAEDDCGVAANKCRQEVAEAPEGDRRSPIAALSEAAAAAERAVRKRDGVDPVGVSDSAVGARVAAAGPPRRTPDLKSSLERIELVNALACELATIKRELSRFCTPEELKKRFPHLILWEHLQDAELKELTDGIAFTPKAYAEHLTLRKFGITSRETLKKDRRKLRRAKRIQPNPPSN